MADLSFITFSGPKNTVPGELVYSQSTNVSVNDQSVYEYHYKFIHQGDTIHGVSYSYRHSPNPGWGKLEIEYLSDNPSVSRVKGMDIKMVPPFVLFVLIFPLIGLIFVFVGYSKGLKAVSLLKVGMPAFGKLVNKEVTNTRINDNPVYRYTFQFEDEFGGSHTMTTRSHIASILEDDQYEELLYDPQRPDFAVTLDDLPGRPICTPGGVVTFSSPTEGAWTVIPAIASILVHGLIAIIFFLL